MQRQVTPGGIVADSFQVRVEGAREFRSALRAISREWPKVMREANLRAAQTVVSEAKRRAPVLTGRLRDSIKAGATQRAGYIKAGTSIRIPYAPVQEFGWPGHNIEPQPYVYPAIAAKREDVIEEYGKAVDRIMARPFPD